MGSRITTFIFLFIIPLLATAQTITTDTKDYQTARQRLYVGTDTSRYVTNIPTAINSSSTKRDLATGKAVWDALSSFITTITTDATLSGAGTSGSPLKIAPQGATTGQVLKYNGTTWLPGADLGTTYTAGTGISVLGTVITNTAPDQTVTISGATGSYPSFTLPDNSATNEIELPSQSGNSGKYLTTNGSTPSWATVAGGISGSGAANRAAYYTSGTNIAYTDLFEYNPSGSGYGHLVLKPLAYGLYNVPLTIKNTSGNSSQRMFQILDGADNPVVYYTENNGLTVSGLNLSSEYLAWGTSGGSPVVRLRTRADRIEFYDAAYGSKASLSPTTGKFRIGVFGGTAAAMIDVTGSGSTSGTLSLSMVNSLANPLVHVYDNQRTAFALSTAPQKTIDVNGGARIRELDTDNAAPTTSGVTKMVITDGNGDLSFANIPAAGITGTAAANAVPYWNAGATALTTGGMTKDATNLNLENGIGLKLISPSAANMILNATATEGVIQTYGSVPLKLNPLGNGIYLGGITGGTGKAVSISAGGLLGSIDVGSGTVTTASVVTANGFSGTVATATTTPAITLSTTVTGILKGNGTSISAATPGTDYVTPTMSANQTITTGNFAFMLDASTASSVISNPFTIRGKADGTNSTQAITFQNAAGTAQSTINITNVGTYFSAVSGKNLILGVGTTGYLFKESGSLQFQNLTVSPSASGNRGGLSYNSTVDRLVYSDGANNYSLATLSDLTNTLSTFASDATPSGAATGNIVDAFSAPRTVTLGSNMIEGRIYTVKGRRNSTNTITVNSESGYTLEIDKDPSIGPTTFNMVSGETITAQRFGTVIIIKR